MKSATSPVRKHKTDFEYKGRQIRIRPETDSVGMLFGTARIDGMLVLTTGTWFPPYSIPILLSGCEELIEHSERYLQRTLGKEQAK